MPYVSEGLPGIGGVIKTEPADFEVVEIPLYEPSGEGPHIYVTIRREGQTTRTLQRTLADAFGVQPRDVGYAGLKDKAARCTQTFSLPLATENPDAVAAQLGEGLGMEVLGVRRHRNKLKPGHLLGNRFRVRVRGGCDDPGPRIEAIVEIIGAQG